jgi:hypothetical protein
MKNYITIGNWYRSYLLILVSSAFRVVFDIINGYGYPYYSIQISESKFNGHIYIHKLFYFLLILIGSSIFYLYEKKRSKGYILNLTRINHNEIELIQNISYKYEYSNISSTFVIRVIFLHVISELIYQIACQYFSFGDYWMVELLIMIFLCRKVFKLKIYKHQQLSLYLISIPFLLKTATIVLFYCDENNHFKNGEINYKYNEKESMLKSLFVVYWWLFPIAFALYFISMFIDSYTIIHIKRIMDFKYISISKILILYGGFGVLITSLFTLATTFISCGKKNDDVYDIYDYQFIVVENNGERYIDSYKVYFSQYVGIDLLFSLLRGISIGLYKLYLLKYVQELNPIFKSFCYPLMYFLQKIILLYQIKSNEPMKFLNARFAIDIFSDMTAFIALLIYLEIIELNFCGLNENLRKYIIKRSEKESEPILEVELNSILPFDDMTELN